jgi:hypothetical protein
MECRDSMDRIASAGEVEIALHQLLRQQGFSGTTDIRVVIIGPSSWPTYLVGISADSAEALRKPLSTIPGGWAPYNATNWVLSSSDVAAILELAGMTVGTWGRPGRFPRARA